MQSNKWYELAYRNSASAYDEQPIWTGTSGEVDGLLNICKQREDLKVLDLACGTGRHAVEFAKRGARVTGVDLSQAQIELANKKALAAGVEVMLLHQDIRDIFHPNNFDLVMMICEAGFGLVENDEEDSKILHSAFYNLRPGGRLVFTALNALYLQNGDPKWASDKGERILEDVFGVDDDGRTVKLQASYRYYHIQELQEKCMNVGFEKPQVKAYLPGDLATVATPNPDHLELFVIATKP